MKTTMNTHILYKAMHKAALVALGLPLLLTSCGNDWLDVSSKTDASTGNFNQTAAQADILLNGCYDGWQGTVSQGPTFSFQMASEYMSDECYGGTGANDARNSQVVDRFDQSQDVSQTDLYNDLWTYYYAAIYNCNELLSMEGNYTWTEQEHGRIIGECRAIRALCYFDLVRMFENVPLVTEPVNENIPQAAPDSVYALIVRDLKYAAAHIPADAYPKADAATNDGRITRYAAEAMLGRVYLFYDGVYNDNKRGTMPGELTAAEALAAEEDVIQSGAFSLISNYKNLWPAAANCTSYKGYWLGDVNGSTKNSSYAGNGNAETVLAMKFNYTGDYNGNNAGNRSIVMFGIRSGKCLQAPYGQGWGGATVTSKAWNWFGTGDMRQGASIINLAQEGIAANKDYQSVISDQREYTGFNIKKYTPLSKIAEDGSLNHYYQEVLAGDFQISQPQDYVLMRYSDVLLMAAELGSPHAQDYFNEVRKRAYTQDDGTLSNGYKELPATEDNILNERKLEFVGEGIRYWDLLRQGIQVAAKAIAASSGTVETGGSNETVTISADNVIAKRGFSQIPLTQIQRSNHVLKQNKGWD